MWTSACHLTRTEWIFRKTKLERKLFLLLLLKFGARLEIIILLWNLCERVIKERERMKARVYAVEKFYVTALVKSMLR
jgi:intergrase/recombinase